MVTVRDFRDRITDPKLLQDIKDFNRQEAQHSLVHNQYNDVLRKQGMPVEQLIGWLDKLLFDKYRSRFSREYTPGHHRRARALHCPGRPRHVRRARHHGRGPTRRSAPCTPGTPSRKSSTRASPTTS